jgi:hypothetical protein
MLVLNCRCKVVESYVRHRVEATNVRDAGTLEEVQLLLDFRYPIASGTRIIDFSLQAQRRGDVLPIDVFARGELLLELWHVALLELNYRAR